MYRNFAVLVIVPALVLAVPSFGEETQKVVCTGKVIDSNSEALSGAKVVLYKLQVDETMSNIEIVAQEEMTTAEDGAFKFEAAKDGDYRSSQSVVLAEKKDYSFGWLFWYRREDLKADITLTEPMILGGRVVDEANEPIQDVNVSIFLMVIPDKEQPRYITSGTSGKLFETVSDANGRFRFERIPAGASAEFQLSKKGRVNLNTFKTGVSITEGLTYPAGADDIELVQPVEARIEGVVIEEGTNKPVSGIKLMIGQNRNRPFYSFKPVESDSNGMFSIDGLPAGEVYLQELPSRKKVTQWIFEPVKVTTTAGQTTKDVRIEASRGGLLEVSVSDAKTGEPVEKASVNLRQTDTQQYQGGITDANGIASFRLGPGQYEIGNIYKEGYLPEQGRDETVTVENDKTARLEMQITPASKLAGIVKDNKGEPAADVEVRLLPYDSREQKTDENGKFEMGWDRIWRPPDEESEFYVIARDAGRNLAAVTEIEQNTETVEIKMAKAVTVIGRTVDANSEAIADVKIRANARMGNWWPWITDYQQGGARTDAEGRFELPAIPYGYEYSIYAVADGYGRATQRFNSDDAEDGRLDIGTLTMPAVTLNLAGIVVDQNDKPVSGARLFISGGTQPEINDLKTDEQGKFQAKVCPGNIQIHANYSDPTGHMWGSVSTQGGAEDVKIVISTQGSYQRFVPREPPKMSGKSMPDMNELGVDIKTEDVNDKMILLCFWDVQQRPSRHLVRQLAGKAQQLKEKGLFIAVIQASQVDDKTLAELSQSLNLNLPVGRIKADYDKVLFDWGVKALPWLILVDRRGIVVAEGFAFSELDEKLKEAGRK